MRSAHAHLKLSEDDFNAVAENLVVKGVVSGVNYDDEDPKVQTGDTLYLLVKEYNSKIVLSFLM